MSSFVSLPLPWNMPRPACEQTRASLLEDESMHGAGLSSPVRLPSETSPSQSAMEIS